MEIQATLGSDIAMVLDECPPWPCEHDYAARSLEMTARWATRCKESPRAPGQLVFGIVQGATFADLRRAMRKRPSRSALMATRLAGSVLVNPSRNVFQPRT